MSIATRPRSLKPLPSNEFFNGIDPERTLRELSSIAPRSYIGLNEQLGAHQSFGERLVNHKEHFVETDHELPGKVTHVQAMLDEELEGSGGRLNQMEVNKAVVSDVVTYVPHATKERKKRRIGKECVSTCRSRGSRSHEQNTIRKIKKIR